MHELRIRVKYRVKSIVKNVQVVQRGTNMYKQDVFFSFLVQFFVALEEM